MTFAATADMVPGRYDVVINGVGCVFLDSLESSIPFRTHRAIYDFSPAFVERQNISGAYGDNQQDFFLTLSQNDFSLGEAQRWFRSTDADRVRRYWTGTNVDPVTVPGQVTLRPAVGALTFDGAVRACGDGAGVVWTASSTHLYSVDASGSISDKSTHGLGAAPSKWGLASDSKNVFLSTTSSGTVGVRKWDGSTFSTFSTDGADSLTFLDNTLYGFRESDGDMVLWDGSGNLTTVFTWKDAANAALTGSSYATRLRPFGGKVAILRTTGVRNRGELWEYSGDGVDQIAEFPANFSAQDMEIVDGIILVSGYINRNIDYQPAIYYYVNGNTGLLWRSSVTGYANQTWPAMTAYSEGIAFTDDSTGKLMQYNIALGGVHTMGTYTVTNATPLMAGSGSVLLHTRNATAAYYFPTTTVVSSGTVITSLIDFENSLQKSFRGIKADFDSPTGSSVDIAYQVDSVDGSWTTLKTGATSGVEYTLDGVAGHAVAVKVTLNKGTSANGPALKRIYVRGAPLLPQYRSGTYIVDCTGSRDNPRELRDGSPSPDSGYETVLGLLAAAESTVPFQITDRLGTYTGLVDLSNAEGWDVYEEHPNDDDPTNSGSYVVRIMCREV